MIVTITRTTDIYQSEQERERAVRMTLDTLSDRKAKLKEIRRTLIVVIVK